MDSCLKVADCRGHLSWVHCAMFSPDGSSFLTSSDDETIRVRNTEIFFLLVNDSNLNPLQMKKSLGSTGGSKSGNCWIHIRP